MHAGAHKRNSIQKKVLSLRASSTQQQAFQTDHGKTQGNAARLMHAAADKMNSIQKKNGPRLRALSTQQQAIQKDHRESVTTGLTKRKKASSLELEAVFGKKCSPRQRSRAPLGSEGASRGCLGKSLFPNNEAQTSTRGDSRRALTKINDAWLRAGCTQHRKYHLQKLKLYPKLRASSTQHVTNKEGA